MKLAIALLILIAATTGVVLTGTAPTVVNASSDNFPRPVRFTDREGGLITDVWIDGVGPFSFVIDTGAGITIVNRRVATESRLAVRRARRPLLGGLSATRIASSEETVLNRLAVGAADNLMPSTSVAAVVDQLPGSIDGILDPVDAFKPLGFTIDIPNRTISAFDPSSNGLKGTPVPREGALVRWLREAGSHKPFVKLSDGQLALLDTGSGFGLAVNGTNARVVGRSENLRNVNDLGGGVRSQKVVPVTVSIGTLELRSVPTDILFGVAPDTPSILGRRALYPFKLSFDPVARLISIEPSKS
jgi:hypothetical protein